MGAGTCQQCQHAAGHTGHRQWSLRHASHTFPWQHLLADTFKDKSPIRISQTNNTQ